MLRYRSKTTKMQKFPIDSYSNENFISPFSARRGPPTPKRGEDTFGTRVRPHAKFGLNRPAGCRKIVDKKANKQKTYSKTNTSPFALTSEWRVIIIIIMSQQFLRRRNTAAGSLPRRVRPFWLRSAEHGHTATVDVCMVT